MFVPTLATTVTAVPSATAIVVVVVADLVAVQAEAEQAAVLEELVAHVEPAHPAPQPDGRRGLVLVVRHVHRAHLLDRKPDRNAQ